MFTRASDCHGDHPIETRMKLSHDCIDELGEISAAASSPTLDARNRRRVGVRAFVGGAQRCPSVSVWSWNWPLWSTSQTSVNFIVPSWLVSGNGEALWIMATTALVTSGA